MNCSICNSDKNVINHHLSYEPELIILICYQCHMVMHNCINMNQKQLNIIFKLAQQYGHLWKNGNEKYRKSKYFKNYMKEYAKEYEKTDKAQKRIKEYYKREDVKNRIREYQKGEKYKTKQKERCETFEYKIKKAEYERKRYQNFTPEQKKRRLEKRRIRNKFKSREEN